MTERPPAAVTEDLDRLQSALAAGIPARTDSNLLIGTWNIRALGDLTTKWLAGPRDSPKRDWHAIACLAAVISWFDVVAVQESRRNPLALKRLMADLGPHWQVIIISDVTEGSASNGERLAFLYDSTRVQPSGASSEITAFAKWMHDWAVRPNDWNSNLIVLGDFTLDRIGDPLYEAFISTSLWPPTELNAVPRTIFDDDKARHFYDQLAWFSQPDGASLLRGITLRAAGRHIQFHPARLPGPEPQRSVLADL